jgi:ABC-2 type transport system permease protein
MFGSQLRQELTVMARNGEQLLLLIGIPVLLLVFFSQTNVLPTDGLANIDFLMPGILSLAIMSTAMVSLGIATGFERSYGVLKRLGTTPLGTKRLVAAKVVATCCIEIAQLLALVAVGLILGWNPSSINLPSLLLALVLGTSCFAGLGLIMAGRLRAEVNLAAQNGLYLVLLLLGGILVPNSELPKSIAWLAEVLPSSLLSELLRSIFGNDELKISDLASLAIWALGACVVAIFSFKWSD